MSKEFDIRYSLFKEYGRLPKSIRIELKRNEIADLGPSSIGCWIIYIDDQKFPKKKSVHYDLGSLDRAFMMAYLEYVGKDYEFIMKESRRWIEKD